MRDMYEETAIGLIVPVAPETSGRPSFGYSAEDTKEIRKCLAHLFKAANFDRSNGIMANVCREEQAARLAAFNALEYLLLGEIADREVLC